MTPVVRYSRFVVIGKHSLWVLIAAIVGIVIWIVSGNNGEDGARLVFSHVPKTDVLPSEMLKPHYQGIDEKGQPYTVVADKAVQKDKETVALENIRADLQQKDGQWVGLNAGAGELNIQTKKMRLEKGVDMFYDGGYEFRSEYANVDIAAGTAYGDSKIEGQGPMGTLKANSFSVSDHGRVIRFNGSVKMIVYPKK